MSKIGRFFIAFEKEIDVGIGFRSRINFACASREFHPSFFRSWIGILSEGWGEEHGVQRNKEDRACESGCKQASQPRGNSSGVVVRVE